MCYLHVPILNSIHVHVYYRGPSAYILRHMPINMQRQSHQGAIGGELKKALLYYGHSPTHLVWLMDMYMGNVDNEMYMYMCMLDV